MQPGAAATGQDNAFEFDSVAHSLPYRVPCDASSATKRFTWWRQSGNCRPKLAQNLPQSRRELAGLGAGAEGAGHLVRAGLQHRTVAPGLLQHMAGVGVPACFAGGGQMVTLILSSASRRATRALSPMSPRTK